MYRVVVTINVFFFCNTGELIDKNSMRQEVEIAELGCSLR